jgi:hypothetical protein
VNNKPKIDSEWEDIGEVNLYARSDNSHPINVNSTSP